MPSRCCPAWPGCCRLPGSRRGGGLGWCGQAVWAMGRWWWSACCRPPPGWPLGPGRGRGGAVPAGGGPARHRLRSRPARPPPPHPGPHLNARARTGALSSRPKTQHQGSARGAAPFRRDRRHSTRPLYHLDRFVQPRLARLIARTHGSRTWRRVMIDLVASPTTRGPTGWRGWCGTWVRDATRARRSRDKGLTLPQGQGPSMSGMKHRPST
jgi:hypothetical protein